MTVVEVESVRTKFKKWALSRLGFLAVETQIRALQASGLNLNNTGWGNPSDKTVRLFGEDGQMQDTREVQQDVNYEGM